jgi:hypothetical protein
MLKHRTPNFPLDHVLNEYHVPPLYWMVDGPTMDVGTWGWYE